MCLQRVARNFYSILFVWSLVTVSHVRAGESGHRLCEAVEDDESKSRRNVGVGPIDSTTSQNDMKQH